ncbi:MAG: tetratricopeptide repeat protein [Gaiellaceae bacterium]
MGAGEDGGRAQEALRRATEHDRAGREAEAIPEYEEALRLGLDDASAAGALLGLGSSLRNVGRADEAVAVLEGACDRYPDHAALRAFRALALASAGRCAEGLGDTLLLLADRVDLGGYERALLLYAQELCG